MLFSNCHPDRVSIVINNTTYTIEPHSSMVIDVDAASAEFRVLHCKEVFDSDNDLLGKTIKRIANITAAVIDSEYYVSRIKNDAVIEITNEAEVFEKEELCILYHGVLCKNAEIELTDCCCINDKEFRHGRKLLMLSDMDDIPVVSAIAAFVRYHRAKKAIRKQNIMSIVKEKTSFVI